MFDGTHDMMDIVDMVELINSVVYRDNMFVAVDNIDRSRKRRKVLEQHGHQKLN